MLQNTLRNKAGKGSKLYVRRISRAWYPCCSFLEAQAGSNKETGCGRGPAERIVRDSPDMGKISLHTFVRWERLIARYCKYIQGEIDSWHSILFLRATDFQLLHQASQHPFLTPGRLADAQSSDSLSCSVSLQCSSSYWPPAFGRYQDGLWGLQLVWMWCSGHYSFKSCSWMDTTATISGLAWLLQLMANAAWLGLGLEGVLTNHVLWGSQSCEFLNSLETETSTTMCWWLVHQLGIDKIVQ